MMTRTLGRKRCARPSTGRTTHVPTVKAKKDDVESILIQNSSKNKLQRLLQVQVFLGIPTRMNECDLINAIWGGVIQFMSPSLVLQLRLKLEKLRDFFISGIQNQGVLQVRSSTASDSLPSAPRPQI
jgi:hypothetical protein